MRCLPVLLMVVLAGAGCASPKEAKDGAAKATPKERAKSSGKAQPNPAPVIQPVSAFSGKIVLVNGPLKYVVVEGTLGRLPPVEQTLNVYRDGQKVGVVVVSNQARGANFAADLSQGEVRVGDTVRSD